MNSAVLFLGFNRPALARQVFGAIRDAKPPRLYFAVDGPRQGVPGEEVLCAEVRAIVNDVDWRCEVMTLFRSENLGCRRAVGDAITWFFEHESEGLILEDDCLPNPDFFQFADEMLERYRSIEEVMAVSGCFFGSNDLHVDESYYFSGQLHIWGWATWRRAWQLYDYELDAWRNRVGTDWLRGIGRDRSPRFVEYWSTRFDGVMHGSIDTWDYPWLFSMWLHEGLTVVPTSNLVTNLGFTKDALHTYNLSSPLNAIPVRNLEWPLNHPTAIRVNVEADRWEDDNILMPPLTLLQRSRGRFPNAYNLAVRVKRRLLGSNASQ